MKRLSAGILMFPVLLVVMSGGSCSGSPEESWTGWRELLISNFEDWHKPLDAERNRHLVLGNVPVEKPSDRLAPELAELSGRWEGYDSQTALKMVLTVQTVSRRGGTAFLYAGQNLQHPVYKKEIRFSVISNAAENRKAITWTAGLYDQNSGTTAAGQYEIWSEADGEALKGRLTVTADGQKSATRYLFFHRGSDFTLFRNFAAFLNSEPERQKTRPVITDFNAMEQTAALDFYRSQSEYTDPGEYAAMFEKLPEDLAALCTTVHNQFIHPLRAGDYDSDIIRSRVGEEFLYPDTKSLSEELLARNPSGFVSDRLPDQRLVANCRYYSILLASVLRSKGIPVRLRYGYASYLQPEKLVSHVVCEVWNKSEQRWMLADPNLDMADFGSELFSFPGDLWKKYRTGETALAACADPARPGPFAVLDMLFHDFYSVMGHELLLWDYGHFRINAALDVKSLPAGQRTGMDRIAELLETPEKNLAELKEIQTANPFLQL